MRGISFGKVVYLGSYAVAFPVVVGLLLVLNGMLFQWCAKQDAALKEPSVSKPAGTVMEVEVRPSLLIDKSTVRSGEGEIFQVRGAVTATKGSVMVVKSKEPGLLHVLDGNSLCVQSPAGQACYPLL